MGASGTRAKALAFLVDDSEIARELLGNALRDAGFEVIGFENGIGLRARIMRDRPDVVVMDVHVPPIDGPELVKMVREHPPIASTPILLTSAASPAELHDLAVACRADSWAPKDNPAAVAARAASLLLRRRIRKSEA